MNKKKDYTIGVEADKIYKQKLFVKIAKIVFLAILVSILVIYFLLYVLYAKGNFTVSLDKNADNEKNLFLSESGDPQNIRVTLNAKAIDYMDNITESWITTDVDNEANGAHNGQNYIAYTFYLLNIGSETVNYWYHIDIIDVIKNVDEAVRIKVYHNGEAVTYAKASANGTAEAGTVTFLSDNMVNMTEVPSFAPGSKDKFTIVIWLEGNDPECVDDIIGGEIKIEMNITEEHTS